jgi:hypothetical protein
MGVFMPPDIAQRIARFIAGELDFPFLQKNEVMAAFYLFGKDHGVQGEPDKRDANDLARKTVEQVAKDVRLYSAMPKRMDANFIRENYTKRSLQLVVDNPGRIEESAKRVAGDPAILSDCFAQHVAYHQQGYHFELFQSFKANQLPQSLQQNLESRMLLLGFNVKDRESLPFKPLNAFFEWMLKQRSS